MGNGINKILPGLFVGNFRDAKDEEQLTKCGITHILSIHDNARPILDNKTYLCIHASDTPDQNLTPYFRECIKFIHEARLAGGSVLVHCLAGVSRSVTITVAYIMTATNHDWRDVLAAVRYSREVAGPNFGFLQQLQRFQDQGVTEERRWLRETYGTPTILQDSCLVENMSKQFQEKQCVKSDTSFTPTPQPSGSTSASFPLNKQEDFSHSSVWKHTKRRGMLIDE